MTMRLGLLCHAATAAVRTAAFPANEPLEPAAPLKLALLARSLPGFDRYCVSPTLRSRQTAEGLGLEAAEEPMLRDCDYGRWTGCSFDDIQAREPEAIALWLSDPTSAPHGGESVSGLIARVGEWLDVHRDEAGKMLAITHASVIRAAVVHAIDAGPEAFWRIDVAPLSLARLSGNHSRWNLVSIGTIAPDAEAS
jgi:broad specificity phosphatase PhoE